MIEGLQVALLDNDTAPLWDQLLRKHKWPDDRGECFEKNSQMLVISKADGANSSVIMKNSDGNPDVPWVRFTVDEKQRFKWFPLVLDTDGEPRLLETDGKLYFVHNDEGRQTVKRISDVGVADGDFSLRLESDARLVSILSVPAKTREAKELLAVILTGHATRIERWDSFGKPDRGNVCTLGSGEPLSRPVICGDQLLCVLHRDGKLIAAAFRMQTLADEATPTSKLI